MRPPPVLGLGFCTIGRRPPGGRISLPLFGEDRYALYSVVRLVKVWIMGWVRGRTNIPYAALFTVDILLCCMTLEEGVEGLSISTPPPVLLLLFLISGIELRPCKLESSPNWISDNPDSMPSNVRRRSSLSFLNCRSVCSRRLSSRYNASSSAICSGVRFSRLRRYCFRVSSLSVDFGVRFPCRS